MRAAGKGDWFAAEALVIHPRGRITHWPVTFGAWACSSAMSAASTDRVSTDCRSRFNAISVPLVAIAFSFEASDVSSSLVRSCQLCFVAGSLWGRPHSFGADGGNTPLA